MIDIWSGNVFTNRKLPLHQIKYGKPQFSYYKEVIPIHNLSDINVTSETKDKPCASNVLNMIHDLWFNNDARNMVVSRGTIGFALVLLSNKVKNLLMFNRFVSCLLHHLNCTIINIYYKYVIFSDKSYLLIA